MALEGLKQDPHNIKFVSWKITRYMELCKLAIQEDGSCLKDIDPDLRKKPDMVALAMAKDGSNIRYANPD